MPPSVVLRCSADLLSRGTALAARLGVPLEAVEGSGTARHVLTLDHTGLGLQGSGAAAPTRVDFCDPSLLYRLRTSGRRQGLGQALGLHKYPAPQVLDATAGLGRDALLMAHLGCEVVMLERSRLIHALLEDGLQRASAVGNEPLVSAAVARLQLHRAEARQWLGAIAAGSLSPPDIVYLDPMFPPRNKSARVKKDIALLHELLGSENDFASLLQAARVAARLRVVVKRPGGKPDPSLPAPGFIVPGKTAHFEVYVSSKASSMP